jgi:hypothetical protein
MGVRKMEQRKFEYFTENYEEYTSKEEQWGYNEE